ncbi:MAG: carboxyl transferase domain-containing protein [Actinomycetota bacterium]
MEQVEREAATIVDEGSFTPVSDELVSRDPLDYPGYREALERAGRDALQAGPALVAGHDIELAIFDFSIMGGSMGEVVGERLARAFERAAARAVPLVLATATGGARMQEGMVSLVQMAKVVSARIESGRAGVPFIAVLLDPTTGGVLASVGNLADVTLAVVGATIGFAGPRVVHRFTGEPLPDDAHSAEFAVRHGLVDEIVEKGEIRAHLSVVLEVLTADDPEPAPEPAAGGSHSEIDPWAALQTIRSQDHLRPPQLLVETADRLVYLRGDRCGEDDPAVTCALVRIGGRRAVVIACDPQHTPRPSGYRKARRGLAIAGRLELPFVTLIDTRGADPSPESEASGIAAEIAATFEAMLTAPVPVLAVVTGEGGSGGALAFATSDVLLAYSDSIFTVLDVEAAAEILWRDGGRSPDAARLLKIGAGALFDLRIADGIIPGPVDAESLRSALTYHLSRLASRDNGADLSAQRRRRWRDVGST